MKIIVKCLVLLGLLAGAAGAQPRVVDLVPGEETESDSTGTWLEVGEHLLYLVDDRRGTGTELFRIDLEGERVERIATLCVRRDRDDLEILWRGTHRALFSDRCFNGGPDQVWTTDGTKAGTHPLFPVSNVRVLGALTEERVLVSVSPFLSDQSALWATDGSEEGSELVLDGFPRNFFGARLESLESSQPWIVFEASHETLGRGLWRSDGTPAGTRRVEIPVPGSQHLDIVQIGRVGQKYWFSTVTPGLLGIWVTDGTAEGSFRVIESLAPGPDVSRDVLFVSGTDKTYFLLETDDGFPRFRRADLWVTDGTPAGSLRLTRNRESENAGEFAREFAVWNDRAYFYFRSNSGEERHLWSSDGSLESTRVWPITGDYLGVPFHRTRFGLLLVGTSESSGAPALWIVDAAAAAPRPIRDGYWSLGFGSTATMSYLGGVHFGTDRLPAGLWVTDGTSAGTKELLADGIYSSTTFFVSGEGRGLWWHRSGGFDGPAGPRELWLTEGTAATTRTLDLPGFRRPLDSNPRQLATSASKVAFVFDDPPGEDDGNGPSFPRQLFASDGTAEGTANLIDFPVGPLAPGNHLTLLTPLPNGRVLFHVDDFSSAQSVFEGIWSANGEPGGTFKITAPGDYRDGTFGQFWPTPDGALVGNTFFRQEERVSGVFRLFIDGRPPLELYPAPADSNFSARFVSIGAALHFLAGGQLFKTDGTPGGTGQAFEQPVDRFLNYQGELVFRSGEEFWSYDGREPPVPFEKDIGTLLDQGSVTSGAKIFGSATGRLSYFDGTEIRYVASFRSIQSLTAFRGGVALVAQDESVDTELWFSDGTAAGTRQIADLWPGPFGSYPEDLLAIGDRLFFTAHDGSHGRELWSTDGTAAGTLQYDVNPASARRGPLSSPWRGASSSSRLTTTPTAANCGPSIWVPISRRRRRRKPGSHRPPCRGSGFKSGSPAARPAASRAPVCRRRSASRVPWRGGPKSSCASWGRDRTASCGRRW